MKKAFSMVLAFAMIFGIASTAYAATDYNFSIQLENNQSKQVSVTNHEDLAREVLTLVNQERKNEGLSTLTWESNLVNPAIRRGAEASVATDEQNRTHTRPNGKAWNTVSEYAQGENLAGGFRTAEEVMEAWMNSSGHRANILRANFTSMAVACVEAEDGNYHWVQIFGRANASSGEASNSTTTKTPATTSAATSTAASSASGAKSSNVNTDGSVISATVTAEASNALSSTAAGGTATITTKNATTISAATLKSLSDTVANTGKNLVLYADTLNSNGGVQGRLYVDPVQFQNASTGINLGVHSFGSNVTTTKEKFEKWYDNKIVVVRLEQQGAYGAAVEVAAKVDLTGLNTNNLVFYCYDRVANRYDIISNPSYSVDSGNFLHFNTSTGGDIIITDKTLTVR